MMSALLSVATPEYMRTGNSVSFCYATRKAIGTLAKKRKTRHCRRSGLDGSFGLVILLAGLGSSLTKSCLCATKIQTFRKFACTCSKNDLVPFSLRLPTSSMQKLIPVRMAK